MKRNGGFTLVEVLVAIAVIAVLVSMAATSFARLLDRIRLTTTTNEFIAALHGTRSRAVRDAAVVVLCPSSDGQSCDNAAFFADGWLITTDTSDTTATLRAWPAPGTNVTANYPGDGYVRFGADGLPRQSSGAFLAGTARFCTGGQGRKVILSRNGRIRTEGYDCASP
ncbi:MAG: GspH/FimT family pseudopilin [Arhodomonas sp.]|nr:GspH/FimT family pseudopilin [Arhodomonas sp.]